MRSTAPMIAFTLLFAAIALPAGADLVERQGEPPPPEQPPPAECGGDPIIGVWQGRRGRDREWNYQFTLHIQRAGGNNITGRISAVWWTGERRARRPPPCSMNQIAFQITQEARGTFTNNRFDFQAESYRVDRVICGGTSTYSLDHFTGTLTGSVLRTVNNDNGFAVNDPEQFRRVRCR
jgi:hypothetical protein